MESMWNTRGTDKTSVYPIYFISKFQCPLPIILPIYPSKNTYQASIYAVLYTPHTFWQIPAMSHLCHIFAIYLSYHVTYLITQTLVDSISLYATILVNKEASNDNMSVIDANYMPEGSTLPSPTYSEQI